MCGWVKYTLLAFSFHATPSICEGTALPFPPQASYLLSLTDTPSRPKRAGQGRASPRPSVYLVLGMAMPGRRELIKSANNNKSRLSEVEIPGAAVIFILLTCFGVGQQLGFRGCTVGVCLEWALQIFQCYEVKILK